MARRGTTLPPCITYFEDHSHEAGNNKNIQFSACLCLQISALNRERYKNIMDYNASEKRNKTADMNRLNSVVGRADTSAVNQQMCAKFFNEVSVALHYALNNRYVCVHTHFFMRDPEVVNIRNDLSGARPTGAICHAQQSFPFTVITTAPKHKLDMPNHSQSNQPQTALLSSYTKFCRTALRTFRSCPTVSIVQRHHSSQ